MQDRCRRSRAPDTRVRADQRPASPPRKALAAWIGRQRIRSRQPCPIIPWRWT